MNSKQLKYGHVRGGAVAVPCQCGAAQTFVAASGRFVYLDAGLAKVCADGAEEVFGFADCAAGVYGIKDKVSVIVDPSAVYRVPVVNGTYALTMRGLAVDLKVVGGIQGADLVTVSDDFVFVVVDGDLVDNLWVDVMLNQNQRAQSGV